ncbi:biotin transporter BioY [Jeotgalibaca sp. MA1X17-3]|uniref:biotin transporter BioY n=1 Tax=Jeotgalibaca sp. MA1X17-3 TaxID=2908211 RepID=UPI001F41912A|nr:biotin transporter BioY [Jeotgalibaca sp. MA1X17-3]UJF16400.1 biotin transporter BioY [Jeotgalibaca sp. MA1X17-3]
MKISVQDTTRISLMAALSFVGGMIAIPVGPVPVTLQTLFVLLSGFILSVPAAFLSQLLHLLLVLLVKGFQTTMSPSFGFLIGFILSATLIAWLRENKKMENLSLLAIIGTVVIYLVGTPYMAFILNVVLESHLSLLQILMSGVILFLPGDIIKGIIAVMTVKSLVGKRIKVA